MATLRPDDDRLKPPPDSFPSQVPLPGDSQHAREPKVRRNPARRGRRRNPWRSMTPGELTALITAVGTVISAVGYLLIAAARL